ncbi:acetyltransferase [Cedecea neteri]|uniref:Shikimate dehydrogenase n=1 Tax=Cedecea neteri TaxID=158822 RepID=A0A291DWJ6_9ENTR|nr:acetyltransferase [Cedecea neteri]ATF91958.1 shikimate dehydrogenase [Cedecea neteri]
MSKLPVVIIGSGGHASVLVDILKKQQREIKAIISHSIPTERKIFEGIEHFSHDSDILKFNVDEIELINAIGASPHSTLRKTITNNYLALGYNFASVIADSAIVSTDVDIEKGVQILTRAVIHPGAKIGSFSVINTAAIIEHDCVLGENNFIAPGAVLCGQVSTGQDVFVGAGAVIIPNITLGINAIVGAGAVLTNDLNADQMCYPARMNIK